MRMLALTVLALVGCGGSDNVDIHVTKSLNVAHNDLPSPFVIDPTVKGFATNSPLPFVLGPVTGTEVTTVPAIILGNICKPDSNGFVVGPCIPAEPKINYCTDGFVIGPCTPLPKPVCPTGFVVGGTSCKS